MGSVSWAAVRKEFPTLNHSVYLNSCSLGLLSNRSREAVNQFLDLWTECGATAWYGPWFSKIAQLRQEFARLINAQEGEIAVVPSISTGLAAISSSLDFSSRNRVVSTELDFPTIAHHFLAFSRKGLETVLIPSDDNIHIDLTRFEEVINDKTALVVTSRVFFTSGYIQDVASLAEVCHRNGALLLVDDYQATGQLPLDVKAAGIDVLLTGGLKWLLGGPGTAYMYVRGDLIGDLNPTATGWFANRDQFDFDPQKMVFKEDARRFESGTPAVSAIYAGTAGISRVNELGSQTIRERTLKLTQDLVSRLGEEGFSLRIPGEPDRHASITIVKASNPQDIVSGLSKRNVIVDARPGGVRISPYFYNDFEDNRCLITALQDIRSESPRWFVTS